MYKQLIQKSTKRKVIAGYFPCQNNTSQFPTPEEHIISSVFSFG